MSNSNGKTQRSRRNSNGKTQRSRRNGQAAVVESTALALPQITRAQANQSLKARSVELYQDARSEQQHEKRDFEAQHGRADRIDAALLGEPQHLQMRFAAIASCASELFKTAVTMSFSSTMVLSKRTHKSKSALDEYAAERPPILRERFGVEHFVEQMARDARFLLVSQLDAGVANLCGNPSPIA